MRKGQIQFSLIIIAGVLLSLIAIWYFYTHCWGKPIAKAPIQCFATVICPSCAVFFAALG